MFRNLWMTLVLAAVALGGCSSVPSMPKEFLEPLNRMTAEEGQSLVARGDRMLADADDQIARGKKLVEDGRKQRDQAEAMQARGRKTLEAAAMAEEAARLERRANELRLEALE